MSFWDRLRRKQQPQVGPAPEPEAVRGDLREFVYIDDVSVQSLLASRTGAIATNYTDSQTSETKRSREANIGVGYGPLDLSGKANREESVGVTAQVVRQSNAQARFKQLRETELDELRLRAAPPDAPDNIALRADGGHRAPSR